MSALGDQDKKIKVAVRIRPKHPEKERYDTKCVTKMSETDVVVSNSDVTGKGSRPENLPFSFDYAFDQDDQQIEVYNEAVLDLVDSTLDGHNATVLAYGQTGSGKTFTMLGEVDENGASLLKPNSGLFLRVLTDLFLYKERCAGHMHVMITLSIMEIYIQEVRDLLNNKKVLKVQTIKDDIAIPDLRIVTVDNLRDVFQYFKIADKQRVAKKTAMNDTSSRSHALFVIDLFQQAKTNTTPEPPTLDFLTRILHGQESGKGLEVPITKSRICLVDLAGSERIGRSKVEGKMKEEAIAINMSLTVLGTVVTNLYKGSKHVSYRDSALTLTLKSVFTDPNCKVLLCANLSPASSSFSETKSTLTFANKVKEIKASSVTVDPQAEIEYLERLKKLEELCGDLRIATVLHEFILQTPARIQHVPLKDEAKRAQLLKEVSASYREEVAKRKAIKAQQEEDEINRLAKEIAQKQIETMQAMQLDLQNKIEAVTEGTKALVTEIAKAEADKKGEIEAKTNEAKKIRRNRRNAEERVTTLKQENEALEQQIRELDAAVSMKGSEMGKDQGSYSANVQQEEEDAKRSEEHHESAQEMYEKIVHLRNHQVDYIRQKIVCLDAEKAAKGPQNFIAYPFIASLVDWIADRAARIGAKQATLSDGESCEHLTKLLPTESWPNPLNLTKTRLPADDSEDIIDAPIESDYEDDDDTVAPVTTVQEVRQKAAMAAGTTAAAVENNAVKPIQYDFLSAQQKKDQSDKKDKEADAKLRQKNAHAERVANRAHSHTDVTKPYDEEEADKHYLMSVYDRDHLVSDLLKYLQCGTVLMKHGRQGKPHKRKFWIEGQTELVYSEEPSTTGQAHGGGKDKKTIPLSSVTAIVLGMFSKVFKRSKPTPATDGFYQAFTLVIKGGSRTIDVVAETVSEFEAWLLGLSNLLKLEPTWGEPLEFSQLPSSDEEKAARSMTPREREACQMHHIRPSHLISVRRVVEEKREEVLANRRLFDGDMGKVFQAMGGIHAPSLDTNNALLMTKGELRYYTDIDIFRTCVIWKLFHEQNLIHDPKFRLPTVG
eukprot:TRINITY_DN4316_c3_g1_i1.p1 TRINITY_DN4316_c3_g1~~TRINITY_DN4316_c3_g1_i1.p1  ORF type:complete len:1057 (+),score=314.94 TRINITY_DN4316_c3_g1_i1:114-3284(+)